MECIDYLLLWSILGSEKCLSVFCFGCGVCKVYIQFSLYVDELLGMCIVWELKQWLCLLEVEGCLCGIVELVLVVNLVGFGQMIQVLYQGCFEMSSGCNFNCDFFDLLDVVIDSVGECFGSDLVVNVVLVCQILCVVLDVLLLVILELEGMQCLLYCYVCDVDLVFDLYCDFEVVIYFYILLQ